MSIKDLDIQEIIDDPNLSNNATLDKISALYMSEGYIVTMRTTNQLQLIKKKEFSLIWATLWLLLWIVGILVYIFYYLSKKDKQINITLKEEKIKTISSIEELCKLSALLKDGHLTQEEFKEQKKIILS